METTLNKGLAPDDAVVIAMDAPVRGALKGAGAAAFERAFFLCEGAALLDGKAGPPRRVEPGSVFSPANGAAFASLGKPGSPGKVRVILYPTRTYSEGFGGGIFSDIAPEDRGMIRKLRGRYPGRVECGKVPLRRTGLFEGLPGYLQDEGERAGLKAAKDAPPVEEKPVPAGGRKRVEFDANFVVNMKAIFASCMTRPNRQDYAWLATKTFGLNLVIRLVFMVKGVRGGGLPILRAAFSFLWYQLQDAVFTVFGQTYMKFLGKMTGLLRVGDAYLGDFLFVYIQLVGCEFLNRLILGPLGENPLVYTPAGIGLIFVNILQGMASGGPITPAINKMRKTGLISHGVMMHCYQVASLTMHFGLFATFGYQKFYAFLTGAVLVFAWSGYIILTTFFKDPEFGRLEDEALAARLDKLAAGCYAAGAG